MQAKDHQSAGLDIMEQETHILYPVFNVIHTSIDAKKVLGMAFNYYAELKLRSSAGMQGLLLTAGIIDNYYDGCLCYEIFNFSSHPYVFLSGFAYIQAIIHILMHPLGFGYSIKLKFLKIYN